MSEKRSALGIYEGYSEKKYDGYALHSHYMTLKSGLRLAYDVYIPTKDGAEAAEPLPLIMLYSPYGRRLYSGKTLPEGTREIVPKEREDWPSLTAYGYVFAIVECRGTGASFGVRKIVNSREEAADGAEALEWLAAQPFCDGNVGTVGSSYKGQSQLEIISQRPPHLRASFIGCTDYNKYDGWIRNGVPRAFGSRPDTDWGTTPEERAAAIDREVMNTVPVDEDPDRKLLREAITEHTQNGTQTAAMRDLNWRNSVDSYSGYHCWEDLSASTYKEEINASGTAIYLAGGNFDVFRRDTFIIYQNLTTPKKLTLGPWYHTLPKNEPKWETEVHRWFDYWLKGIDNGITREKPYAIHVANYDFAGDRYQGEGTGYYRSEDSWPLHEGRRTAFYPGPASGDVNAGNASTEGAAAVKNGAVYGSLGTAPDAETSAFTYHTVYGIRTSKESKFTTEENGMGVDQQGIVFTGAPLTEEQTFIGHPMMHIAFSVEDPGWMAGGKLDTDFFATVSDFDPVSGRAFQFSDGHLRASLRAVKDNPPYDFLGLPWHENLEGSNEYLETGKRYDLDFDLMPAAYCLKPGHCLRVTLSNAVDRMYYHGRLPYEADPAVKTPVLKVYTGWENPTRLVMPNIYEA